MESLASFIISLAVVIPLLSIPWIYRHTKKINSPNGMFSVVIFAYTIWHFFVASDYCPPHAEAIAGAFIIITALMNVYCTTYTSVNVGINRRKEQQDYKSSTDRRKRATTPALKDK